MEKARAVLDRLDRIEGLRSDEAPAEVLLDEVRALLAEAEEWVREEPSVPSSTLEALDRSRQALAQGEIAAPHAIAAR